jgi:hypothetical protein
MRDEQFIDFIQTAGIIVIAAILAYAMIRLERALNHAAKRLKAAISKQQVLDEAVTRIWQRVEAIESLVRERNEILPTSMLKSMMEASRRLDQTEADKKGGSNEHLGDA